MKLAVLCISSVFLSNFTSSELGVGQIAVLFVLRRKQFPSKCTIAIIGFLLSLLSLSATIDNKKNKTNKHILCSFKIFFRHVKFHIVTCLQYTTSASQNSLFFQASLFIYLFFCFILAFKAKLFRRDPCLAIFMRTRAHNDRISEEGLEP